MNYRFTLLLSVLPVTSFAGVKPKSDAASIAEAYDNVHHWGGEASGNDTPERIKEINDGVRRDCAKAMALVKKLATKNANNPQILGPALLIVDTCDGKNVEAWIKKHPKVCARSKSFFAALKPDDNADAAATYSMRCANDAAELNKKK